MNMFGRDTRTGVIYRAGPADAGKRLLHGIGVVFQRGPGRGSRGRRIRGLRTGIRIGTSRKRAIAGCRAPNVTLKPRSCSSRPGRDSEDFGVRELQLTHVFAGHTGDHHRRAGAQPHADPIHIRFTIRKEREPSRAAGYATRPGEVGVIDRRLESVAAASVHRHHAHVSYHGGKCHLLAGCGLADGAKRHRFGDAEGIVGQGVADSDDSQRFERGHATLVGDQRSESGVHSDAHIGLFYSHGPFRPQKQQNPLSRSSNGFCSTLVRDSRGHALNLAGLEALDAHAQASVLAINRGAHRLQVRAEATLGTTVRMGNGETGLRSLAAHCATSCHDGLP